MEILAQHISEAAIVLRQGDVDAPLEVAGHVASVLDQCREDAAAAEQLLGCVVLIFSSPDTQELLDAIALDVGPPLLALSHLSRPCATHATRLAQLLVEACKPREVLTLVLEALDTCRRRLGEEEEEGLWQGLPSCLVLALNLLPLLARVLASVQRRRLQCATDALAQLAALADAVSRCCLSALMRGHATANAVPRAAAATAAAGGAPGAAEGPATPPGSAAELAAAAAGPAVIWPEGAQLEEGEEEELAAALGDLVRPFVQCAADLLDKVFQPEFQDAAIKPADSAASRTKLQQLLLHLLAALFAPSSPALSCRQPLAALLAQLLQLLESAGSEAKDPLREGGWEQLLRLAEGAPSAEGDEPFEFPLAPAGAALLVLAALEQQPGAAVLAASQPGAQPAPAAAFLSRWSRPPGSRLDTLRLGCSMSKALIAAARRHDSGVLLLKAFQLLTAVGQLAAQKQPQQQQALAGAETRHHSGELPEAGEEDALLVATEVLEVLAVNIAHGPNETTRGAAFSCLKALLAGLPPRLRYLALLALSGMPSPNVVALSMQLLQQQITLALARPGTPQACLFAAPSVLAPVHAVLSNVLSVVKASEASGSAARRLNSLVEHADAASAAVNIVRCLLLHCQAPATAQQPGLSPTLATAVNEVHSDAVQPLAQLVAQMQGLAIEYDQTEYLAVERLTQVLQHIQELA